MTKLIPLTRGQSAIVDDTDFEWLSQWKWCALPTHRKDGYYAVRRTPNSNGKLLFMHKFILGATTNQGDHINGNKLDNRRDNLRPATRKQNLFNRCKPNRKKPQTSQYKGVYLCQERKKKWSAH